MPVSNPKANLHRYLQTAREVLLWKLDGLSEYDVRRPMTPTGTNLLGLVKHVASVEAGYFGVTFGRPFDEPMPWYEDDAEPNADMWATADESREQIIAFYHRVWTHSDVTIDSLELDAVGHVPHWPKDRSEVTLHQILVHMTAETHRHADRRRRGAPTRQRQHGAGRPVLVGRVPESASARGAPGRVRLNGEVMVPRGATSRAFRTLLLTCGE
jgi:uncharacterized damage-inducible protein DinB